MAMKRQVDYTSKNARKAKRARIAEGINSENELDNFVEIINSLSICDDDDKCLKFSDTVDIFQFPLRKIYMRGCYEVMFKDICKSMLYYDNVVITGQPGIGKTSFIYALLYFIKNLRIDFDKTEKKYLLERELNKESEEIEELIKELNVKLDENRESLEKDLSSIESVINTCNVRKEELEKEIKTHCDNLKKMIVNGCCNIYNNLYSINNNNNICTLYNIDQNKDIMLSIEKMSEHCKERGLFYLDKINRSMSNINTATFDVKDIIMNNLKAIENKYKYESIPLEEMIEFYILIKQINTRMMNIINLNYSVNINNARKSKLESDLAGLDGSYGKIRDIMSISVSEIKQITSGFKECEKYEEEVEELKGFNYYFLDAFTRSVYDKYKKTTVTVLKDIYIVKGKKNGKNEAIVYLFKNGKVSKVPIQPCDINDSIIIVDTFNGTFKRKNKIISISSPDHNNNDKYTKFDDKKKELYFDSLGNEEIEEWFEKCIGFGVDVDSDKFKETYEKYGNIPRQIYFHYLYDKNYNRDYWKYYTELIEGVVGSTRYNDFLKNYMDKEYLKKEELSNILLKYDFEEQYDKNLRHNILTPKDHLKFVSDAVEKYIVNKFYPVKDETEYQTIKQNIDTIDDDDKFMKRIAMKQIIAYELSTGIIELEMNHRDANDEVTIIDSNPDFKLNSEKHVSIHYPVGALHYVYYILDEENYFDLIINGVFIKIFLDDEEFEDDDELGYIVEDETEERIRKSIKDYSEDKKGTFMYAVIKNYNLYAYDVNFVIEHSPDEKPPQSSVTARKGRAKRKIAREANTEVYIDENDLLIMRKCFDDMLNIICRDNFNYDNQRNYLIFGHSKIGKTVLSHLIRDCIHEHYRNIRIIYKYNDNEESYVKENYFNNKNLHPYIVISDGGVIGEDDYADAKSVILLANPYDEKYKTFQNKRCPLLMYIPPFTKEEVNKVKLVQDVELVAKVDSGIYEFKELKKKSLIMKKNDFYKIGKSCKSEIEDLQLCHKAVLKLYDNNFEYYGGVIGNYKFNDVEINKLIERIDEKMIDDILKGISKSSLSKTNYDNILIYETYEDDVTKSGNLRFITETIRNMVICKKLTINSNDRCKKLADELLDNPGGGYAGNLYEKIVLYLMKKGDKFQENIVRRISEMNRADKWLNFTLFETSITTDADLKNEIQNKFQTYHDEFKMPVIDLGYRPNFPDVDAFIGPIGIQITKKKDKHSFAAEMTMILQNLNIIFKDGYHTTLENSLYKTIKTDPNYSDFAYYIISNKENPKMGFSSRTIGKYPECIKNITIELKGKNAHDLFKLADDNKGIVHITFQELKNYAYYLA